MFEGPGWGLEVGGGGALELSGGSTEPGVLLNGSWWVALLIVVIGRRVRVGVRQLGTGTDVGRC